MSPIPETLEVDEQVAITLASIGYLGESATNDEKRTKMSAALGQPDLPTRGEWALAWGPAEHEATRSLWYAASGSDASGAPALAVVIRGTQMSRFESLRLDFELWLDPLPFEDPAAPAGVKVSRGFATEFSNLLAAVDGSTNLTGYQFLSGVLQSEPDLKVNVIGHSLGGATAPIMAMWMKHEFPGVDVQPFPFAGQSPGNHEFATWYSNAFPQWPTRYVNRLDIVPLAYAELPKLKTVWDPVVACPDYVKLVIDGAELDMHAHDIEYAPTDRPQTYDGALYNVSRPWAWEHEASAQHAYCLYMYLSGIPLAVIRKGLGPTWSPPPAVGGRT